MHPVELFRDLLIYALGDEGPYDSFEETPTGVKAYVPAAQYDALFLEQAVLGVNPHLVAVPTADAMSPSSCEQKEKDSGLLAEPVAEVMAARAFRGATDSISYIVRAMPDKDWNAAWEKNHQAVLVDDFCWVRAPFHPHREDVKYEIVIEPKMSFGTAHHATTYMMLSQLRLLNLQGCQLLDMGCGTAVLSILAAKMGACHVDAVDVDEWAFNNANENIEANGCKAIVKSILGDAEILKNRGPYDVVLANINLNILLRDLSSYVHVMHEGTVLLLSGFYEHDIAALRHHAASLGLRYQSQMVRQEWASIKFIKDK